MSTPLEIRSEHTYEVVFIDDCAVCRILPVFRIDDWMAYCDYANSEFLSCHPGGEMTDNVNHPQHYNDGKIEVIEFIEDKNLGFHLGNAVKYIARAGKKNPDKYEEDLEKAIWYIRRRIELKKENPRRPNDMVDK